MLNCPSPTSTLRSHIVFFWWHVHLLTHLYMQCKSEVFLTMCAFTLKWFKVNSSMFYDIKKIKYFNHRFSWRICFPYFHSWSSRCCPLRGDQRVFKQKSCGLWGLAELPNGARELNVSVALKGWGAADEKTPCSYWKHASSRQHCAYKALAR